MGQSLREMGLEEGGMGSEFKCKVEWDFEIMGVVNLVCIMGTN